MALLLSYVAAASLFGGLALAAWTVLALAAWRGQTKRSVWGAAAAASLLFAAQTGVFWLLSDMGAAWGGDRKDAWVAALALLGALSVAGFVALRLPRVGRAPSNASARRPVFAASAAALLALAHALAAVSYHFDVRVLLPISLALAVAAGVWCRRRWAWWLGFATSSLALLRFLRSLIAYPIDHDVLLQSSPAPFVLLLFVALLVPRTRKLCLGPAAA